MNVTFTLTAATSGTTAAGPFNISGTTSGNTTSQLATGITKNQLTTGYTINSVNDAITGGTIASTGSCNTTTTWSVSQTPPVSLGDPLFIFYGNSGTGAGSACLHANNNDIGYRVRVWTALVDNDIELMNGHYYYNTDGSPFDGTTHSYWATFSSYGVIGSDGKYTYSGNCL